MFPSGGSFVLNAAANHPSGAFTARTNASFSLAARHFGVGDSYDEEGQTTQRTIAGGAIASGRKLSHGMRSRSLRIPMVFLATACSCSIALKSPPHRSVLR